MLLRIGTILSLIIFLIELKNKLDLLLSPEDWQRFIISITIISITIKKVTDSIRL